jgi:hypothetical protein
MSLLAFVVTALGQLDILPNNLSNLELGKTGW